MAGAMLLVAGVLAFALKTPTKAPQRGQAITKDRPLRRRRQPWYRRFKAWRSRLLVQPYYWKIGKQVANLNQTHGLAVGGSGSGKSTLVVALILQPCINSYMWFMRTLGVWKRRGVLIISFDRSDPIEEATNVLEDRGIPVERWRVRQSNGWDLLQGDIEMIAEALPDGYSRTADDTGFFRQLATDAISAALHEQDDEGVPRDFDDMLVRMDRIMADDPETPDLARRTWVRRFRSLARVMGESIGHDFDLVGALKAGKVVHLSSNSYTNPAITPLIGAMAITHAKLAAEQVGDVYLVLEEAGFLKHRKSTLEDLARSMRARGWRVVYLSQDPNDVGDVLQVNFGVAVFMGLGPLAQKAREWCASVVKGFPGAFRAEELVLGATIDTLEGYVLLNGRCRDVSLAPYITGPAVHRMPVRERPETIPEKTESAAVPVLFEIDSVVDSVCGETEAGSLFVAEPVVEGPPRMPEHWKHDAQLENIWLHHTFPGGPNGCHVSTYRLNNRGRPMCSYLGVDWMAYMLSLALADGLNLGEVKMRAAAGELTVDHRCENIRCTRADHLTWESRSRNSELLHERKRVAVSASR